MEELFAVAEGGWANVRVHAKVVCGLGAAIDEEQSRIQILLAPGPLEALLVANGEKPLRAADGEQRLAVLVHHLLNPLLLEFDDRKWPDVFKAAQRLVGDLG